MSVPVARRNTFHAKGKLILAITSIAAALTMIFLVMGLRSGLYATLAAFVDNIGVDLIVAQSGVQGLFSSDSTLALSIHEDLQATAGAKEAGHILIADVIFTRNETKAPIILVGYDPDTDFGRPWKLADGRLLAADDEIVLDAWLAKRTQSKIGDEIELLGRTFTLVGLTRETASWMSPYVFLSLDAAETALGLSDTVSFHLLRFSNGSDLNTAISAIEEQFPGTEALTPNQIAEADQRVLANVMDTPIIVILVISVVIGIAVIGLTAYTTVSDRIREYGVLKAVGASDWRLAWQVLVETVFQSVLGYLLGIALTLLSANAIMRMWPQFTILITAPTVLQVGLLSLLMAAFAALLPIRRLSRIDPLLVFKQ